ncbi:MAG: exosortase C-terminal domain/associated protein EpsI [Candidatus Zixiibacteriota bacterium]
MSRSIVIACCLVVAGGAFGNYLRYKEHLPDRPPVFETIPYAEKEYVGEERRFEAYSYDILKADTTTLRLYRGNQGESYWLFVAYFQSQKYGSQIHSPKHCLPGGGWRIDRLEPFALSLPDGGTKNINRLIIADREQRELMFYWFETRGGGIRNEFALKWDLMKNSLLLRPTDAAIVRLTTPFLPGEKLADATARGVVYLDVFYPAIERALPFGD